MIGTLILTEIACCNCLTHFAMDSELNRRAHETGRTFYCPNGHPQVYTTSEVDKLKKQLDNATKRLGWAEASATRATQRATDAERSRAAIKGQLTKTRRRIANGVCPCCNRTFSNVARHMQSKHKDFVEVHND